VPTPAASTTASRHACRSVALAANEAGAGPFGGGSRLINMLHVPRVSSFQIIVSRPVARALCRRDAEKLADAVGRFEAVAG
jgi:hypothetical protein